MSSRIYSVWCFSSPGPPSLSSHSSHTVSPCVSGSLAAPGFSSRPNSWRRADSRRRQISMWYPSICSSVPPPLHSPSSWIFHRSTCSLPDVLRAASHPCAFGAGASLFGCVFCKPAKGKKRLKKLISQRCRGSSEGSIAGVLVMKLHATFPLKQFSRHSRKPL